MKKSETAKTGQKTTATIMNEKEGIKGDATVVKKEPKTDTSGMREQKEILLYSWGKFETLGKTKPGEQPQGLGVLGDIVEKRGTKKGSTKRGALQFGGSFGRRSRGERKHKLKKKKKGIPAQGGQVTNRQQAQSRTGHTVPEHRLSGKGGKIGPRFFNTKTERGEWRVQRRIRQDRGVV